MDYLMLAALTAALMSASSGERYGSEADEGRGTGAGGQVIVANSPALRASLGRLWHGSASWRAAVEQAQGNGRSVLVLTPDQVVVETNGQFRPFDPDLLAEVTPVTDAEGRVHQVLVVINLPLVEALYARRFSTMSEVHADLDRIVAHEVYGHALPYLLAGDLSGQCADPLPGERPQHSCAIRRENTIRAELGLGQRTDGGLNGLALTRRFRD